MLSRGLGKLSELYKCQLFSEVTLILTLLDWESSGDGRKAVLTPQIAIPAPSLPLAAELA